LFKYRLVIIDLWRRWNEYPLYLRRIVRVFLTWFSEIYFNTRTRRQWRERENAVMLPKLTLRRCQNNYFSFSLCAQPCSYLELAYSFRRNHIFIIYLSIWHILRVNLRSPKDKRWARRRVTLPKNVNEQQVSYQRQFFEKYPVWNSNHLNARAKVKHMLSQSTETGCNAILSNISVL